MSIKTRLTVNSAAIAFGEFIRRRRVKEGFTQVEAAGKAEMYQSQWSRIERGRTFLYDAKELLNISKVLKISSTEILKRAAGVLYDEDSKKGEKEEKESGWRALRIPPQAIQAEVAILRIIFHNNKAIQKVKKKFSTEEEFYKRSHHIIYKTMLKLFSEGKPIDLIILVEELRNRGKLEDVGGISYLNALFLKEPPTIQNDGYSPDNLNYYIEIMYEKYLLRSLIVRAQHVVEEAYCYEDFKSKSLERSLQELIPTISKILTLSNKKSS